jgi:hypothetical protein
LKNWLYQIERQKNLGYTAAIAEAEEDASEREAALALKRDVDQLIGPWAVMDS